MWKAPVLIAISFLAILSGCVLSSKQNKTVAATPAAPKPVVNTPAPPPPQSLSVPQTQVQLPKPQPLDPAALETEPAPPVGVPPDLTSTPRQNTGRRSPPPSTRDMPPANAPPPSAAPPAQPPPATVPSEPAAQPIREIVSAAELKKSQEQALSKRKDVQQMMEQITRRGRLSPTQQDVVTRINSFLATSEDAEKKGDMKQADALADRAQVLAKDLLNGK